MAIALILVCGPLRSDRVEAATLYAVDWAGSNNIYTIDLSTGAASLLSATSLGGIGGIAFDDAGTLHAIDVDFASTTLYQIHPPTGASAVVGLTGTTGGEGGLTYDASAPLFYSRASAISGGGATLELISISPTTGAATTIGNMGLNVEADVSGMAPLSASTLLAYDSQSALADRMLSIDKGTGVATVIGPTGMTVLSSVGGLALDPDTGTYYVSNGLSLFSVDPGTGAATLIGPHGESIAGLAFGPPVSCMLGLDMTSNLYDISAVDGSGSNIRLSTQDQLGGLALAPDGTLYASRATALGELYTLDIVTGAATLVGGSLTGIGEGGLDFRSDFGRPLRRQWRRRCHHPRSTLHSRHVDWRHHADWPDPRRVQQSDRCVGAGLRLARQSLRVEDGHFARALRDRSNRRQRHQHGADHGLPARPDTRWDGVRRRLRHALHRHERRARRG